MDKDIYSLQELIELDGFDKGAGHVDARVWMACMAEIRKVLEIQKGHSLLEVGCGAGALLRGLGGEGLSFSGFDMSSELISVAQRVIPEGSFWTWDLAENGGKYPSVGAADLVIIHGVLHYLTKECAEEVVREALRLARNKIFVGEIPALESRDRSEELRRNSLPPGEYIEKYSNLSHTYFSAKFFSSVVSEDEFRSKWSLRVFPKSLLDTPQAHLRYAVLITRDDSLS